MIEPLVYAFVLTLVRIGSFIYFLPLLGGPTVPRLVKIGLSFALTLVFFEDGLAAFGEEGGWLIGGAKSWLAVALVLGREMLLGGILGFALSLFLVPARVAGEFLAQESGLTFANVVSATGDGSASPFATLFELLASLLFLSLDLHHLFLTVLQRTFRDFPIGHAFSLPRWDILAAVSAAEEGGILLAMPVALCLFLTTIVLALMTRAAPQLNLYSVGFPFRVLVSLGALLILLPQLLSGILGLFSQVVELLQLQG